MNQLKNGTLLVAVATIVTIVLILMTGRDSTLTSAPEKTAILEDKPAAPTKAVIVEANANKASDKAVGAKSKLIEISENVVEAEGSNGTTNNVADNITSEVSQQSMEAASRSKGIAAPAGPFTKTNEDPGTAKVGQTDQTSASLKQHDLLNHIVQPIWMDQKLGDFKSMGKGEAVFKMMPTNPGGIQGENPDQVVTSKENKLAPTSIPANYNYQLMPIYNGGYYVAPMPSYLMPSILPTTESPNSEKTKQD